MPDEKTVAVVLEQSAPLLIVVGEQGPPGPSGVAIVWGESPSGAIDGVNTLFSLAKAPSPSAGLLFFLNGLLQRQGIGNDFTISGVTIAMAFAPIAGDSLIATYPY